MNPARLTFDPIHFEALAAIEDGHFWFEERRRLLLWSLRRHFPTAKNFCDVGCGTGFLLAGLAATRPELNLTGVDFHAEGLAHAALRLPRARLVEGDVCHLPFREEFDVVGCCDVLEHIPDDRTALAGLARSIRPGGGLILTVPQHPGLWSAADEIGHHQRRYARRELRAKIEAAGLVCRRITSFMMFLLPVMWLKRRASPGKDEVSGERHPPPIANSIGRALLRTERRLIASGLSLPCGGSLLVIARKPTA